MQSIKYLKQRLGEEATKAFEKKFSEIMRKAYSICPKEEEPNIGPREARLLELCGGNEDGRLALARGLEGLTETFSTLLSPEDFKKWLDLMSREEPSISGGPKVKTMFSKPEIIKQVNAPRMDDSTEDHESCNRLSIK